jgi:hypothetical protein
MKRQKAILAQMLVVASLVCPAAALAQSAGRSGGGSAGSAAGSSTTPGIASGQSHISPPGTNSLGTANSSGVTTGMAGAEPTRSERYDEQFRAEDSKVDSKINNICRGC